MQEHTGGSMQQVTYAYSACMLCVTVSVCTSCRDPVIKLSSLRNTQGFWQPSPRLQAILLCKTATDTHSAKASDGTFEITCVSHDAKRSTPHSPEAAVESQTSGSSSKDTGLGPRLNASRPKECVEDSEWATMLVLGFFSKHCGSEQQLWSDMQSKAVLWVRSTAWGATNSIPAAVAVAARNLG